MGDVSSYLLTIAETGGILTPLLFIGFHLLRPLFFLPVILICITGGVLFGAIAGTLYSVIGITLSSMTFYKLIQWMPGMSDKLVHVKQKLMGERSTLTTSQVAVLRLIPFIHFHLLSLCILEISSSFKEYVRSSFYSNIPLAVLYTSFGKWISSLSPVVMMAFILFLLPFLYFLRRKQTTIKWAEFFVGKSPTVKQ
ncbi:TVP38/TMEM64 family protein [Sediminibacillus dalangtanensis]|uniref:TVP38/TMEM64 family protein n=1 Tax=Sediminibacillus dalangtanensis TaxID=2729421 RepID=A0ABX7VW77_9BACI|nr:VTT domain-containing protein [Sediminibacillus dalangtanensis]QTN00031.1 TVP38/TMEM64 family protein [Sediminibacillus dalangtanensis]